MFHITFVQIAEFNWLPERQKGLVFETILNYLLRNHEGTKLIL